MFIKFINTLLLVLVAGFALGQQVTVPNPPRDTAANVSIGQYSVWSVYPDEAEFVLNFVEQRLLIVLFEGPEASDWSAQHHLAIVGQVAPDVYRAEVEGEFWVEVNARTGETFWHDHCVTTSYRPPCREDHTASLR